MVVGYWFVLGVGYLNCSVMMYVCDGNLVVVDVDFCWMYCCYIEVFGCDVCLFDGGECCVEIFVVCVVEGIGFD